MKQKITLIATCVVLAAAITVGGTLAWFTDAKDVQNVVTFGNVKISLTEPEFDKVADSSGTYAGALPGTLINKDPTVTNVGSNDAWIRAKVEIKWKDSEAPVPDGTEMFTVADGWQQKNDGFYYYQAPLKGKTALAAGEQVALFKEFQDAGVDYTVLIPSGWTNSVVNGRELQINVSAQAVQADNKAGPNVPALWADVEAFQ